MDATTTLPSFAPSILEIIAIVITVSALVLITLITFKRTLAKPDTDSIKDRPLLWAWSLNALLNEQDHIDHFIYAGAHKNHWASNHKAYKKRLEQWWGIDNKRKAIDMIEALTDAEIDHPALMEKSRLLLEATPQELDDIEKDADDLTTLLIDNIEHIRQYGFMAWDYVRAQSIIAWAYQANYFDLAEARSYALKAATKTQKVFSSWEQMSHNYCLGYHCWMGEDRLYKKIKRTSQHLLTTSTSPWLILEWNTDLTISPEKSNGINTVTE